MDSTPEAGLGELMPLAGLLGIETLHVSPEEVRLRLAWSPQRCTAAGIMHGGAIMALADSAGGWLASLHLPPGATGTTTTDSTTRFLGAVRDGHAEATARLLHKGRTIVAIDTEVRDASGRLVARTSQAQLVLGAR
ncbi:MAG: PaaI family thioesterase [Acidimicrobiales bacterium]